MNINYACNFNLPAAGAGSALKLAIVTGAGGGLGTALFKELLNYRRLGAASFDCLLLLSRHAVRDLSASLDLLPDVKICLLDFDLLTLCDEPDALVKLLDHLFNKRWSWKWLINNAGCGKNAPFAVQDAATLRATVELNALVPTLLTHSFLQFDNGVTGGLLNTCTSHAGSALQQVKSLHTLSDSQAAAALQSAESLQAPEPLQTNTATVQRLATAANSEQACTVTDDKRYILNIASSAAWVPQADFAVYGSTKSYLYNWSLALAREMQKSGTPINVCVACPGPMPTDFLKTAGSELTWYKRAALEQPAHVAKKAIKACFLGKRCAYSHIAAYVLRLLSKILPLNLLSP